MGAPAPSSSSALSVATAWACSATWPLGAVVSLALDARSSSVGDARSTKSSPHATLLEHVGMQFGCVPRLLLAVWVYAVQLRGWQTFATTFAAAWVVPIVARNVLLAWVVGGVTDGLLLSPWSPWAKGMARHKYSEQSARFWTRNGTGPIIRDVFWSTVSACIAAAGEVALLHAMATGRVAYHADAAAPWWRHGPTVLLMLSWPYTQNIQFYALHRLLHPWGTTSIPDVGAFLYKHVHSLHHVARNPSAFSGISMVCEGPTAGVAGGGGARPARQRPPPYTRPFLTRAPPPAAPRREHAVPLVRALPRALWRAPHRVHLHRAQPHRRCDDRPFGLRGTRERQLPALPPPRASGGQGRIPQMASPLRAPVSLTDSARLLDGLCASPCLLSSPTPPRLPLAPQSLTQVNFAENHLPLDLLFGTWAGDETEARASMRARGFAPGAWKDAALEAAGGAEGEPVKKPLHAKKAA